MKGQRTILPPPATGILDRADGILAAGPVLYLFAALSPLAGGGRVSRLGVAVLGATGSVGRNALDVISRFPRRFRATALCAGTNARALAGLARAFRPRRRLPSPRRTGRISGRSSAGNAPLFGEEGMREAACAENVDIVLAAASGISSIRPVIAAAEKGKRIALANKEALVMAGKFVTAAARRGRGDPPRRQRALRRLPGDRGSPPGRDPPDPPHRLRRPVRTHTVARMRSATVAQALGHPTWRMGAKISVDSATLMNKGLEVIEATWLFGLPLADRRGDPPPIGGPLDGGVPRRERDGADGGPRHADPHRLRVLAPRAAPLELSACGRIEWKG